MFKSFASGDVLRQTREQTLQHWVPKEAPFLLIPELLIWKLLYGVDQD